MKRSVRFAVAGVARVVCPRVAATERRLAFGGLQSASSATQSGIPKGLNTSNPFEIKFHIEDTPLDSADEDAAVESCCFEDEIEKFHSEMIGVFGSEPEEHDHSSHEQPTAPSPVDSGQSVQTTTDLIQTHSARASQPQEPVARQTPRRSPTPSLQHSQQASSGHASVVLIQGPCTFIHQQWVGSKDRWPQSKVAALADDIAQSHGFSVMQHHSNHEGQILDWLLNSSPSDKIILNWNGRLQDSPTVYRALSTVRASVVILAPLNAELGPLPPSVKNVICGDGAKSLELAILACK